MKFIQRQIQVKHCNLIIYYLAAQNLL